MDRIAERSGDWRKLIMALSDNPRMLQYGEATREAYVEAAAGMIERYVELADGFGATRNTALSLPCSGANEFYCPRLELLRACLSSGVIAEDGLYED